MVFRSLHFHRLWVRHAVNHIVPLHIGSATVRNMSPPHLEFPFPVGAPPFSLCSRSFQSHRNPVKTFQNLCCQIEVSFILDSFLIGKPWSFNRFIQHHWNYLYCNGHFTYPVIIRFLFNVFPCHFFLWYVKEFTS